MRNPTYLSVSRHGIYYFRMPIPKNKRSLIGKAEIKKSLRTRDPKEALKLARKERVVLDKQAEIYHGETRIVIERIDPLEEAMAAALVVKQLEGIAPPQVSSVPIPPSKPSSDTSENDPDNPLLSKVITDYCSWKAREHAWTEKTTFENVVIFELFLEIVGDMPIQSFDHSHSRRYAALIPKLPPNRNKAAMWRDLSVEEILDKHPKITLSISSINRHIGCVSGLMSWAIKQGYVRINTMNGMTYSDHRRADKQRDAFSSNDLKLILAPQKKYLHPHYKWLPLMGLYSGARIEELCSLYLKDIRQVDGIWVFDINENTDDKRLKNKHSERLIPIHQKLIDTGFLKFVDTVKGERLFLELNKRRDGYSQNPSRWFGAHKKRLGIKGKKSFHSFRHTFITAAQNQAMIEQPIIRQLVGHGDQTELGRYAKRFPVSVLKDAIDKIQFDY